MTRSTAVFGMGAPLKVSLGSYNCQKGVYEAEVVITASALSGLVQKAIRSKDGRASIENNGIVVRVVRTGDAPPGGSS